MRLRMTAKMRKWVLTCLLVLGALMPGMSITAYADNEVAQVGDTAYASFGDALQAWGDGTTLTLLADVTTSNTIGMSSGTKTFDLNDHSITKTGATGSVFKVTGGSLTVNGPGSISGGNGMEGGEDEGDDYLRGGGFYVSRNAAVTVDDVTITGNSAEWGGGVFIRGTATFTMNDGTISQNQSIDRNDEGWTNGGGVWIQNSGTFIMNGGLVTENTADEGIGGVHAFQETVKGVENHGVFIVSGNAIVANNTRGDSQSNVGGPITVGGQLTDNASIGVTHDVGVFTNTASENLTYNDASKFTSDNESYSVAKNADGQLFVGTAISSVAVTGISAPEAGSALDTVASTDTANVTLKDSGAITWAPAAPQDGNAAYATTYEATVTATANEGYAFADNAAATVNGQAATVTKNQDGTLAIAYEFDKTALIPVTIAARDKQVTYSATGITIPVDGMFDITEGAGAATYSVANGTGEGAYDTQTGKLSVTKCGTFTVKVGTAVTDTHAEGEETTATLTVNRAPIAKARVTLAQSSYAYDGKAKKPAVRSVVLGGKALAGGADYTVSYKNNTALGTATALVSGTGNYHGTAQATFTIALAKPKLTTFGFTTKSSMDARWGKIAGAKGYELQYRLAGGSWKSVTTTGTSRTVKGMKSGQLYELRVRATAGSVKGPWSAVSRRYFGGVSGVKASSKKAGTVTASWKKDSKANAGYEVLVRYQKDGTVVAKASVSAGKTSATVKGLAKGRKVWVEVRPLRKSGGSTYVGVLHGAWGKA